MPLGCAAACVLLRRQRHAWRAEMPAWVRLHVPASARAVCCLRESVAVQPFQCMYHLLCDRCLALRIQQCVAETPEPRWLLRNALARRALNPLPGRAAALADRLRLLRGHARQGPALRVPPDGVGEPRCFQGPVALRAGLRQHTPASRQRQVTRGAEAADNAMNRLTPSADLNPLESLFSAVRDRGGRPGVSDSGLRRMGVQELEVCLRGCRERTSAQGSSKSPAMRRSCRAARSWGTRDKPARDHGPIPQ